MDLRATIGIATNRNPLLYRKRVVDFGPGFNPESMDELRFAKARVTFTDADRKKWKSPQDAHDFALAQQDRIAVETFDEKIPDDPEARPQLGSRQLFDAVRTLMLDGRDTVVYVHGFNTTFKEAAAASFALRWAIESLDPTRPINVVTFTWPSDGKMTPFKAYKADRLDAQASGPAFGRAFLKLYDYVARIRAEDRCDNRIHLLCHSMGNFVLQNALAHIAAHVPRTLPRVFDEIVLVAADVDADAFEHQDKLARLAELGSRISVYCNPEDNALIVGDLTKGTPSGSGSTVPRTWPSPPTRSKSST